VYIGFWWGNLTEDQLEDPGIDDGTCPYIICDVCAEHQMRNPTEARRKFAFQETVLNY
jgi:hypothetical protein